jgi:hypothetical protein
MSLFAFQKLPKKKVILGAPDWRSVVTGNNEDR